MTNPVQESKDKLISLRRVNYILDVYIKQFEQSSPTIEKLDTNFVITLFKDAKRYVNDLSIDEKILNEEGEEKL